jgi:hypothetical protein
LTNLENLYGLKLPKCTTLTYPKLLIIGKITNNETLENNGGEQRFTTSSMHFVVHNSITFTRPNQIRSQHHWWTYWINKPFAQLVDQENNYPEYSHNHIVPSISRYNQWSLNYWDDAPMFKAIRLHMLGEHKGTNFNNVWFSFSPLRSSIRPSLSLLNKWWERNLLFAY